jgi:Lrp/AsnC family transcriptional regulator, regulator for asnA, asnC and gidA
MDQIDWQIIDMLLRDARTPFSEIGKRLGLGKHAIQKRVKKLNKEGVLETPISILDSKKCGFEGIINFFIKLDMAEPQVIESQLSGLPYILTIAQTFGDYNLYISSFFRNIDDINQIIAKLKNTKSVQSYEAFYYSSDVSNPLLIPFISGKPENSILYKICPFASQSNSKQKSIT